MKHHILFSSKDKSKKIKVLSAAILIGTLRVKVNCTLPGEATLSFFVFATIHIGCQL